MGEGAGSSIADSQLVLASSIPLCWLFVASPPSPAPTTFYCCCCWLLLLCLITSLLIVHTDCSILNNSFVLLFSAPMREEGVLEEEFQGPVVDDVATVAGYQRSLSLFHAPRTNSNSSIHPSRTDGEKVARCCP